MRNVGLGVFHEGRCRDFHGGRDGGNLEGNGEVDHLAYLDLEILDFPIGESLAGNSDAVACCRDQCGGGKHTGVGGLHRAPDTFGIIGNKYGRVGHCRA